MVENLDQQTADVLRKQQRGARADRALNMGGSFGGTRAKNSQGSANGLPLRLRQTRANNDDTKSIMGSLRHRARQNMSPVVARGEAMMASALTSPVRLATSEALAASWINLIDSFGLTLIYINIHVLMRLMTSSDFFCPLGHEWSKSLPGASTVAGSNAITKEALEELGDKIGIPETLLLLLLDLIVAILVIAILVFFVLIVYSIVHPTDTIGKILGIT